MSRIGLKMLFAVLYMRKYISRITAEETPILLAVVGKLEKHFDGITSCEVILKVDKPESDGNKIAELQLTLPKQTLFNSKQADSFEEAVLQAVDAMKVQLTKYKEKL